MQMNMTFEFSSLRLQYLARFRSSSGDDAIFVGEKINIKRWILVYTRGDFPVFVNVFGLIN